jgi:hypothetical protein
MVKIWLTFKVNLKNLRKSRQPRLERRTICHLAPRRMIYLKLQFFSRFTKKCLEISFASHDRVANTDIVRIGKKFFLAVRRGIQSCSFEFFTKALMTRTKCVEECSLVQAICPITSAEALTSAIIFEPKPTP